MASMQLARRVVAVGALAVAAAVAPAVSALTTPDAAAQAQPGKGQCLAWFGSRDGGKCIGWAESSAPNWSIGTDGITTGPLLPGQSFTSTMP
jgi:hypothetical protein